MTYDINMAQCLRDVGRLGYTEVHNICTGTIATVPWGIAPWFGVSVVAAVVIVPLAFFVWLNYPIWMWKRRFHREGRS